MAKAISIALKTFLATATNVFGADLYTITLASGVTAYYTTADIDIPIGGHTYLSTQNDTIPGFVRGEIKLAIGLQAEELQVDMLFNANTVFQGTTPAAFAVAGGFDNAIVVVDKLLTDDFNNTTRGVVNLYTGIISDVETLSTRVTFKVSSGLLALNAAFPRNYFLPACNHALFDANCGLLKSAFAINGTVAAGSTNKHINSALAQADGWFSLGYIVMNNGVNTGQQRSVKLYAGGGFDLLYPFTVPCGTGDSFTAYPGCDKTEATCGGKFNNLGRFRGYPFVPSPETIELGSATSPPNGNNIGIGAPAGGHGGQNTNFKQN